MMLNVLNSWRKEITVVGDMTPAGSDITPIPESQLHMPPCDKIMREFNRNGSRYQA
jgi:hypothetical protein